MGDPGDWSGMPQDSGSGMPQGSGGNRCDEAFCTGCLRYLYCETQEADANCETDEAQQCMQRCSECPPPPGMDGDHSGYTGSGPSRDGSGSGPWHDSGMESGDWSGMDSGDWSGMPQDSSSGPWYDSGMESGDWSGMDSGYWSGMPQDSG